ncbi:hypothetical protein TIFTF001_032557 [Ficus carica]|uniref:Uncharacterized protein n=1 Tax=Ficus carica TaxID=3494 RepID=A0AA88DXE6_FICCA|nr:hypothetical protein TIFTF001_032557 [Ficus carica]
MTKNFTIGVAFSGPSLIVIGRQISPAAQTYSLVNMSSGVWMGAKIAPPIFSLVKVSMNKMSAELPLSIRIRRTMLLFSLTRASLCAWRSWLASSLVRRSELSFSCSLLYHMWPPLKMVWIMCLGSPAVVRPVLGAQFSPVTVCNLSFRGRHPCGSCSTCSDSYGYGRDVSPTKEFRPLMYFSASVCLWAIPFKCAKKACMKVSSEQFLTCMMNLSKQSGTAAEKTSGNYLYKSIVPNISFRYPYRAVLVKVRHSHDSGGERQIDYSDLLQPVPLTYQQRLRLTPALPKRSNTEVMFPETIIMSFQCYFQSRRLRTARGVETDSSQFARVPDWVTWFLRVLRLPICSTTGPRLLSLSADRCRPIGEESSASSSRAGWGRVPQNSLKVGLLFYRLGEVCKWCGGAGELGTGMIEMWLLKRRGAHLLAPKFACKRKAHRSKGDTNCVSAKGTPMLKSVMGIDEQAKKQSLGKAKIRPYVKWSRWVGMPRVYGYLTSPKRMPRALPQGSKDMYSDRFRMSGVRWCRVVGTAGPTTVRLSAGMGQLGKGSMGLPSLRGLSCGRGSVAQANTLEPNGDLLEILKGELIRGLTIQRRSSQVVGSSPLCGQISLLVLAHLVLRWEGDLQRPKHYTINIDSEMISTQTR